MLRKLRTEGNVIKVMDQILNATSIFIRDRSQGDLILADIPKIDNISNESQNIKFYSKDNTKIVMSKNVKITNEDEFSLVLNIKNISYIISLR